MLADNHDPKHLREEFEAVPTPAAGSIWKRARCGGSVSPISHRPHCRALANTADDPADTESTVAWRLEVHERDLDSNVIVLPPEGVIETHTGPDLDVLVHVLAGSGELGTERGGMALRPGALVWLPRRSQRRFAAGRHRLRYLTVHRRREALILEALPRRAAR